jgi:PAS domain S-box-containing protein
MEEITGYSTKELTGMKLDLLTHSEDRERDRQAFADMLGGKRWNYSTEKRYVRKDGRVVWVLVNVARVNEASGEPPVAVAVIQDITTLKEAQQQLQEALRLREEFLSIASHELKTPLTALLMQVQSVQRLAAREPSLARYEHRLERAVESALRLDKLIVQLLDVSRLTEGRLPLEPEPFELGSLVGEVVSRFDEAAEQARSPITLLTNGAVEGMWDRLRIDQVVTNLVSNALKYGAGQPVEISVLSAGDEALVAVRDHGIGMSKEQIGRIFRRFERGVEARSYGGFGLGLWIGMEIARASGGTIDVESVPGGGARFTLRLPIGSAQR